MKYCCESLRGRRWLGAGIKQGAVGKKTFFRMIVDDSLDKATEIN